MKLHIMQLLTFFGIIFACMNRNKKHRFYGNASQPHKEGKDMEEKKQENMNQAPEDAVVVDSVNDTPAQDAAAEAETVAADNEAVSAEEQLKNENEKLKKDLEKEKKEYLFLMADFDNYRKHVMKERAELIKNAGEKVFQGLLPIVDDMERAVKYGETSDDPKAMHEGMVLILNKLKKFMEQNGVKEMVSTGEPFDADKHEAISVVPVPDESQKGKVLDTVNTGYMINDKVLRHAKVVVAQ